MLRGILGIVIALLMLFLLFSPALAANVPVVLTAAQISYDDHSDQIEAIGNVEIKYKDVNIAADTALLDQKLKMLLATGDVTVTQNGDTYQGDQFIYDMRAEQGWMRNITTEMTDTSMKEPAFFEAELGMFHKDDLFLKKSEFTSCNLSEPHYHLTAEKLEYYPDDRMILHKAWYWEGKHRLLYLPYLFISLKEENESPFEVDVGRDADTGWFLYVGYRFYLNKRNQGLAYTKITEWGGDGLGFKNTTRLSEASKWYQDFYFQDNSDNDEIYDEYKLAFGYENNRNAKFKIKTDIENWYNADLEGSNDAKYTLNIQGTSPYPSVSLLYEHNEGESEIFNIGESWNYQTKSDININTNGSWYNSDNDSGHFSEGFRYYLNTSKNWAWSNLAIKVSDSRVYSTSGSSSQNYLPEITFNIPKWKLPWVGDISYTGQYTKYQYLGISNEVITSEQNGERLANNFTKTKTLWQNTNFRLYTDSKLLHRYYIVNGQTSGFSGFVEALNLQKTFRPGFSTTVGINYTVAEGSVPSVFVSAYNDSLITGGSLTNSWIWNWETLNANINGGYNFTRDIINPIYLSANWNPGHKGSASFSTVMYVDYPDFNYYTGFGNTSLSLRYTPKENWRINFGINYDARTGYWYERYFESFITQQLTKNWKGRLSARYSDVVGDFSVLDFDLTYDWHCRELIFSYDYIEGTYSVTLNIKAFPQASLSTDTDPTGLLFK